MNTAVKELNNQIVDEEQVYMYYFRSMDIWNYIMNRLKEDPNADMKYFQLMHGEDIKKTLNFLDEYSKRLKSR